MRRTALELAAKIEEIMDAAERSAAAILQEAEASAQAYLAERRRQADRELEERTVSIAKQSAALRADAERVLEQIAALERAGAETLAALRQGPGETPGSVAAEDQGLDETPGPVAVEGSGPGARARPAPEEALLRAAQMAIAGSSRDEIEQALIAEFGTDSPGPIVDEILGD